MSVRHLKDGFVENNQSKAHLDEAALLWERMKANSGGKSPPEFLSTHPSNDSRIANLRALSAKAKEEARKFGVTSFK